MNARDNTPLRSKIALYLSGVESATAAEVAQAAGLANPPSRVINELNAMRSDALVECEPRGKKKEIAYWLAVPLEQIADAPVETFDLPGAIKPGTRAAQIWNALRDGARLKAAELTTMLQISAGALDPALSELFKTGVIGRTKGPDGVYRYHRPRDAVPQPAAAAPSAAPAAEDDTDDEMPPADPALLASANRMLCERMEGVAHVLRGSGLPGLREVTGSEDLQPHVAVLVEVYQIVLNQIEVVSDRLAEVVEGGDIEASEMHVKELAVRAAAELKNARARVENLQHEVDKLRESLQGRSGLCASQIDSFLMLAAKRKPRRITKIDNARAAAVSAIRAGAQRAEVFALVPVGKAVRGAEWKKKA